MTRPDPLSLAIAAAPPASVALVAPGGVPAARARLLLAEAAPGGGGVLLQLPSGVPALVGVAPGPATRAAALMEAALGRAPRRIPLPEGAEALLEAPPPPASPPAPSAAPRLRPLLDAAGAPRAQLLSPGAGEREAATRGLLRALLGGALLPLPGLRLFLECPLDAPPGALAPGVAADDGRAPVAVLPLLALAQPAALPAREAGLRAAGWATGLLGDDAAALDWMDGEGRWALAPPGREAPALLPARLVLLGPRPAWAPPWALHEGAP